MQLLIFYIAILLPFCILDAIWLTSTVGVVYKPALGDMLLSAPRMAPLIVFYLLYPVGLVFFAGMPALKSGSAMTAFCYGAAIGAFAYATYDLTNYATLRNWTFQVTAIDILWGTFASATASALGYVVTTKLNTWLG